MMGDQTMWSDQGEIVWQEAFGLRDELGCWLEFCDGEADGFEITLISVEYGPWQSYIRMMVCGDEWYEWVGLPSPKLRVKRLVSAQSKVEAFVAFAARRREAFGPYVISWDEAATYAKAFRGESKHLEVRP